MFPRRCAQLALAGALGFGALVGSAGAASAESAGACNGDVAVGIGAFLNGHVERTPSLTTTLPSSLDPGLYRVDVVTSDGYGKRSEVTQPHEQVTITFEDGPTVGPTADLADDVDWVSAPHSFEAALTSPASWVRFDHVLPGVEEHNSVRVDCVAFTLIADAPPPPPPPPPDDIAISMIASVDCAAGLLTLDFDSEVADLAFELSVAGDSQTVTLDDEGFTRTFHDLLGDETDVVVTLDGTELQRATVDTTCEPEPGDGEPGDGEPGDGEPGDGEPGDGEPGDGEPGDGEPGDGEPGGGEPGDGEPGDGEPGDGEPGDGEPGDGEPGDGDPLPGDGDPLPADPIVAQAVFSPSLALSLDCRSGAVDAVLVNDGDADGQVTLAVAPSTVASTVALGAASTTTVTLPLADRAEGSRTEVVAVTDDGVVLTSAVLVDCLGPAEPTVELDIDCAARTATLLVGNAGGELLDVTAFAEQVAVLGTVSLVGGDSTEFSTPITAEPVSFRVIDGAGADVFREVVEHDCEELDVTASLSFLCPAAEVQLVLDNTVDEARIVTVAVGDSVETVELDGGEQVVLARTVTEPIAIRVESAFGDLLFDDDAVTVDCGDEEVLPEECVPVADDGWREASDRICDGVSVRLVVDCASDTAVAHVTNNAPSATEVEVVVDGTTVRTLPVAAWASDPVAVEGVGTDRVIVQDVATGAVLLDAGVACHDPPDRTAATLGGLLIALMTVVAAVVAVFDPWIRV